MSFEVHRGAYELRIEDRSPTPKLYGGALR
jgi:hypothetical protein